MGWVTDLQSVVSSSPHFCMGSCISKIRDNWDDLQGELLPKIALFEKAGDQSKALELRERLRQADPDAKPVNIMGHYKKY